MTNGGRSTGLGRRFGVITTAFALAVTTLSLPMLEAEPAGSPAAAPAAGAAAEANVPAAISLPPMTSASSDASDLAQTLVRKAPGLRPEVLKLALEAMAKGIRQGLVPRRDLLTVIDYSIPSDQPRLFTFDLGSRRLVFRELVAHGKNSGENRTERFSNEPGSLESSLGLFVTAGTYFGGNGYSLRLRGLEEGFNDLAWDRMIVLHGASYVSEATARALGRLGRSWGCPAVPKAEAGKIIDKLKGGTAIFAYYPDQSWLKSSAFLR